MVVCVVPSENGEWVMIRVLLHSLCEGESGAGMRRGRGNESKGERLKQGLNVCPCSPYSMDVTQVNHELHICCDS